MSLLDTAKSMTNTIKKAINASITSSTISYGFIGISTAILGYYTFFENDIEAPPAESEAPSFFSSDQPKESGTSLIEPKESETSLIEPKESGTLFGPNESGTSLIEPKESETLFEPKEEPQKKVSFFGGKKKKIRFA
jgi:hypothetical protein